MLRHLAVASLCLLLPSLAATQGGRPWAFHAGTADGQRSAVAGTDYPAGNDTAGFYLGCVVPLPGAPPGSVPLATAAGELLLTLTEAAIGADPQPERQDVSVAVDGAVLPLGRFRRVARVEAGRPVVDYIATISASLPAITALRRGNSIVVNARGMRGTRFALAGADTAIARMLAACAADIWPAAAPVPGAAPAGVEALLRARFGGDIEFFDWLTGAEGEALAFVYRAIPGANAMSLDVAFYRDTVRSPQFAGLVRNVFGEQPRDAVFRPDAIEVTLTTPRPGDPRCCPTGQTRYSIDRATLQARPLRAGTPAAATPAPSGKAAGTAPPAVSPPPASAKR